MVAKAIAKLLKEGAKKGVKKAKEVKGKSQKLKSVKNPITQARNIASGARYKIDEAFTPKKLKEKEAALRKKQKEKEAKIKKEMKSDDPVVRAGSETKAERAKRLARDKKAIGKVKKEQKGASRSRQVGTALGATVIGSGLTAGVVKGVQDKKAREKKAADTAKKEADRKRKSERVDTALSAFAKKSKERTAAKKKKAAEDAAKKRKEDASKIKTSLFSKVTGKGPKDRNITRGGKKLANVTRGQLTRLGLDPNKKSDLRKYLNAFDRMGTRPTKKSDLVAGKMMGGMMKRKGMAKGGAMKKKGYAMGGAIQSSSSELMNLLRKLDNDEDKKELMKLFGKKLPKAPKAGTMPSRLKEMIKVKAAAKKPRKMSKGGTLKKPGADQKGLKKLPTAVRNKMGYMAKGGMTKKGYAKGGMSMKKKGYSKGGAVRKGKRGMGAATRGGGAIMR